FHAVLVLVGDADYVFAFDFLAGERINIVAKEREYLARLIHRADAVTEGRRKRVAPDSDVFLLHIVVAGEPEALEGLSQEFLGNRFVLQESAIQDHLAFGGAVAFLGSLAWFQPEFRGPRPAANHGLELLVKRPRGRGFAHGFERVFLIIRSQSTAA